MSQPEIVKNCPVPEDWIRFAAGHCDLEQQAVLLEHASRCGACASRLKDLVNAVSEEEADSNDAAIIDQLSARLEQRRGRLSRLIVGEKRPPRQFRYWRLVLAASLAIAVAGVWLALSARPGQPPFQLLAEAYTARRTMDLQIPRAGYAPLQVTRSSTNLSDLPPALLESQLRIKRHLEANPEDPGWLHAQGRAQLLLWQFNEALRSFQTAADLGANSPEFLIDYASAYYQRAERNSAALDYALALEKLSAALKLRPDDPSALFNRAIVDARLHQYDSAIDDFEHALRVQTDSKWKEETQKRLDEIKRLKSGLFSPARVASGKPLAEQDLETAMASDLAGYFHAKPSKVVETAEEMIEQHQDPWLKEVVQLRATPDAARAIEILSVLTNLRINGDPRYENYAAEIRWLIEANLPIPLRVWRDYELLSRDTRSSAVATCDPGTSKLIDAAQRYPWMKAQILLESSVCSAATQDFVKTNQLLDRAEGLVKEQNLLLTAIRIPIFRAHRLTETGYFREAVQIANDSLARIEAGPYPLRRAYDYQSVIMLAASQLNLPNTGRGAARMMARIGEATGIQLFAMIGLCREAGFALLVGRSADAAKALQAAEKVLINLGNSPTARIYWRTSRIAWFESQQDAASLYRMLDEAHREGPAKKENLYFNRKLIAALCRLESQAGHRAAAERLAEQLWGDINGLEIPGDVQAFRPELESVSKSVTRIRLEEGDSTGGLESWKRFLGLDEQLLGGRNRIPEAKAESPSMATVTVAGLGEKVAIWIEAGGRIRFHWASESYSELARRIHRVRRLCSLGVPANRVSPEVRALYGILFPAGVGTASEVYIRSRDLFDLIPLATFLLVDEGRQTEFSFLPFNEESARGMQRPNQMQMTLVAATDFDPKLALPPLPEEEIEEEIHGVRQAFADTTVIRGASATARALEQAAMHSQALHFTGHAAAWQGGTGLLVSPDATDSSMSGRAGVWSMGRPRSVKADLVVLSACSTGAFQETSTVEPGQLALSMLLAGAHHVVASLWDTDSTATAAWNQSFYKYLAAGQSPGMAVKAASEELRMKPGWQSPKYWAGFALYQN